MISFIILSNTEVNVHAIAYHFSHHIRKTIAMSPNPAVKVLMYSNFKNCSRSGYHSGSSRYIDAVEYHVVTGGGGGSYDSGSNGGSNTIVSDSVNKLAI